jgi:hypothetical protein
MPNTTVKNTPGPISSWLRYSRIDAAPLRANALGRSGPLLAHRSVDFAANVEGSKAAIAALRPAVEQRDPDLVKELDSGFAAVDIALAKHRAGDGYKLHTELSRADLKELSDVINTVAEPISKVAAAVAK